MLQDAFILHDTYDNSSICSTNYNLSSVRHIVTGCSGDFISISISTTNDDLSPIKHIRTSSSRNFFLVKLFTTNDNLSSVRPIVTRCSGDFISVKISPLIARFMGPTWGPPGSCRSQVGPCSPHEPCYLGRCHGTSQTNLRESCLCFLDAKTLMWSRW